MKFYNYLM